MEVSSVNKCARGDSVYCVSLQVEEFRRRWPWEKWGVVRIVPCYTNDKYGLWFRGNCILYTVCTCLRDPSESTGHVAQAGPSRRYAFRLSECFLSLYSSRGVLWSPSGEWHLPSSPWWRFVSPVCLLCGLCSAAQHEGLGNPCSTSDEAIWGMFSIRILEKSAPEGILWLSWGAGYGARL